MKILIVTPHYPPDGGPSAPLFAMLSEALVRRGHAVTVIAAKPHYPSGIVPEDYIGKKTDSIEKGVRIIRVWVPSWNRSNLLLRMFQFLCYQVGMTFSGIGLNYDVLATSNPALQTGLPFIVLGLCRKKPTVFSVHDVYPNAGIDLGIFRSRISIDLVSFLERFCLRNASKVRILSDSFSPALQDMGVPCEKMELIYDWVDTELIKPMPKDNAFSREHKLVDKFVVLYAGNIGLSQKLENLLKVASMMASDSQLQFVLIGDGASKSRLYSESQRLGLKNVLFIPYQPRSRLSEVLASASVSLVILQKGIGFQSLPSKIYSIFSSGRPVLASIDVDSDGWSLIERSRAGICIPPEDTGCLLEAIQFLKNHPESCLELGFNGRRYAEENHSPFYAAIRFERILQDVVKKRNE